MSLCNVKYFFTQVVKIIIFMLCIWPVLISIAMLQIIDLREENRLIPRTHQIILKNFDEKGEGVCCHISPFEV